MIIFMNQFQHFLPLDIKMAHPKIYKELFEKLAINIQPSKVMLIVYTGDN